MRMWRHISNEVGVASNTNVRKFCMYVCLFVCLLHLVQVGNNKIFYILM